MKIFLLVTGIGTLLLFGLPILLTPMRWARVFKWDIPKDARLARYFARSLGCTAVGIGSVAVYFGLQADPPRDFLLVPIISGVLLAVMHLVGAIERSQPWTETAEIPFWLGLAAWGIAVYLG